MHTEIKHGNKPQFQAVHTFLKKVVYENKRIDKQYKGSF